MKLPISWLKDYVDIKDISPKELANRLTLSGSKVEGVEIQGEDISNVVVGKILKIEKHPDADRLQVTQVDVGNETIQIVTGAQNINVNDYIPVALSGSTLPGGVKINKGKLRGVESNGMMCSIQELNLTKDDYPEAEEHGIFILEPGLPLGKDIKQVLGLDEVIIDLEITSNRPDCLSIVGMARETAGTLETPFKFPRIEVKEEAGDDVNKYAKVTVEDGDLCPRYAARVVKNIKIGPSPAWMRHRLRAAGVRPINNIVDITNYVMLELGQPMHAFDLEYLAGKSIIVRRAKDGETMKTLDEQDRVLDSGMLIIADEEKAVAVAGVMGGANSEITENTKTILFESANFNGTAVRLAAKKLGLRTEASGRFEKGLDPNMVINAVNRAVQLVEELGAGVAVKGIIDCYEKRLDPWTLQFRPEKINALLGTRVTAQKMAEIFRSIDLSVDEKNMTVTIPTFRADLEREADLAEEVARFIDYNNIEPTLMDGKSSTLGRKNFKQKVEDVIKSTMMAEGFSETMTYSFTSPRVFDQIRLPADSSLRNVVTISNPLGEEQSIMRTTIIPDMLVSLARNYNRRVEEVKLFEVARVYQPKTTNTEELPEEKNILTIGMYGNADFYDLKGVMEQLLESLGIKNYEWAVEKENPTFHPGRTGKLLINGKEAGFAGEIHPEVQENFEIGRKTYIGVVETAILTEAANMMPVYKQLPKFPSVSRDIAVTVKDEIMVKQIEDIIAKRSGKLLEKLTLFDVYKGKQIAEGFKSVAYSITFRAEDRTLTDEEVNKTFEKIINGLERELEAQLRV